MTQAAARWIAVLILTTTACSRGRCTDNQVPPVQPSQPPRETTLRKLNVEDYEAVVYGAAPSASFAATTSLEHDTLARLIPSLYDGARSARPPDPKQWQADAAAAGFEIQVWKVNADTYWALVEAAGKSRGAGAYIFRVAPPLPDDGPVILLQAPHNLYDMGTGKLAADLFFSPPPGARPRAMFTNTIHRYQLAPGDKKKRRHNPADVAHNPEHGFTIATESFAIAAGGARVIQLHGFGSRSDEDDDDIGNVAAVISAGDEAGSSPLTAAMAQALVAELGGEVKRYPEEVRFLGATTNVQGRALRKIDHSDFVHLEMSADLRKRLAADPVTRGKVGSILFNTQPRK
jgi:hypothetical protein